jgi:hypothetical protein
LNDGCLINKLVSQFDWQSKIEIKEASLAHILEFGTSLAHLSLFVAGIRPWLPPENSEGTLTDLAFPSEL